MKTRRWAFVVGLLASLPFWKPAPLSAQAAPECTPKCRKGYACQNGVCAKTCEPTCGSGLLCHDGQCISACNPPCAAGEICAGEGQCVSACNPTCEPGQVCTAEAECVSACSPACGADQVCTPKGECVSSCNPPCASGQSCKAGACEAPPPPVPAEPEPPPPPEYEPGKFPRTHDGFYFSLGLGVGSLSGTAHPKEGALADLDLNVSGVAQLGQLAIGGTVAPGLVVGGAIYGANVFTTKYEATVNGQSIEDDGETSSISQIGPFVDYYFDPEGGAHAFGAPVVAIVSGGKAKEYDEYIDSTSGSGFGFVLGAGYDFWIGEQWSLGLNGRAQWVTAKVEADDGDESDFSGAILGVLVTVTNH